MKRLIAVALLSLFTASVFVEAASAQCGTNSGKRYYNGKCV
jgi:hypothetical protein